RERHASAQLSALSSLPSSLASLPSFLRPSCVRLSFHSPCAGIARTFSAFQRGRRGGVYLAELVEQLGGCVTGWPWPIAPVAAPSSSPEWRKSFSPAAAPRRPSAGSAPGPTESPD